MFNTFFPVVLFKNGYKPTLESPFISGNLLQFKQFKGAEDRLVLINPYSSVFQPFFYSRHLSGHKKIFGDIPDGLNMTICGTMCSKRSMKIQFFQIWRHPGWESLPYRKREGRGSKIEAAIGLLDA
jgi:hypothetical protein